MKTIRLTAFSILLGLLVLVFACKKETNPATDTQSGSKISVTGQDAGIGLKSTMNGLTVNWVAGTDKIGLYSAEAGSNGTNAQYTAASTGATSSFTGSMTWGTGTHHFYAYYPWVSGSSAVTAVPISLPASQTQSGNNNNHIGALDFTVANATATPGAAGQPVDVNLNFNHVFTLLEFDLQLASGQSATQLSSIELYSTAANLSLTSGTIDLTQASPTGDNSYTIGTPVGTPKVTLNVSGCNLTSGSVTNAYMMILPGTQISAISNMTIKITSAAGVTVIEKPGISFVKGKRYTIDLSGLTFSGAVSDVDSHTYQTVTIGTQVWMASNLNTSKYNDGTTAIPNVTVNATWAGAITGAWCDYNNDPTNSATYGKLYNWYAVDVASNGGKNICPVGWHIPSDDEWTTLINYLGGDLWVASIKLKETGTTHWESSDSSITNETGFTALPGGYRDWNGTFTNLYEYEGWWSSTASATTTAWCRAVSLGSSTHLNDGKYYGFSVRCIKD